MPDVTVWIKDGPILQFNDVIQCLPPQPKLDYWVVEYTVTDTTYREFLANETVAHVKITAQAEEVEEDEMESATNKNPLPPVWDNDSVRDAPPELPHM